MIPSTLLSNAMKFAHMHARSFRFNVLALVPSDYMCLSSNIQTHSFPCLSDQCQAKFMYSCHVRMHRVIFYISNMLRKLMIRAKGLVFT